MTGRESRSSRSSVLLSHGSGAWVICHAYPDRGPILTVVTGGSSLTLSQLASAVTADDVAFARGLASAAQTYLAECERLAAAGSADLGTDPAA